MVLTSLPVLQQHKLYLQAFWKEFGGMKNRRWHSPKSKAITIAAIITIGEVRLYYRNGHDRKKFDKLKNKRRRFDGFTKYCFACHGTPQVRHHLIWLSHGGRNVKINIIALCNDCHALIHPWLAT